MMADSAPFSVFEYIQMGGTRHCINMAPKCEHLTEWKLENKHEIKGKITYYGLVALQKCNYYIVTYYVRGKLHMRKQIGQDSKMKACY